uniref:Uncharacterized protein n=1 Tax=Acanthochromis polyacanthus TaxID=80966 RepID=A0A3Q1F6A9_9TELE
SAISSGSLEQSLPAAGTKTWNKVRSQRCCGFLFQGSANSSLRSLTLRSILAKPRALDALSLASWNSSLSDRLPFNPPYLISSEAVLSSALSQNSLPLFCRPASRNSPVDLSSIPAMSLQRKSFPDWASPPRM